MNLFKWVASGAVTLAILAGCGGGGGSSGTPPFGGGGGTTPTPGPTPTPAPTVVAVDVLTSSPQMGTGGDAITVTAVVKGTGNVALADTPVMFSSDTGTLTGVSAVTDDNGIATASVSVGANKSNRTVAVTATAGTVSGSVNIEATGTTLSYAGETTVAFGGTSSMTVTATDSKGIAIANLPITVASSLGNGLSSTSLTTNASGLASVTYTATNSGTDQVTFTGGGVVRTTSVIISGENFQFVSPAANTAVPVGTWQEIRVRYVQGGQPQAGRTVNFAATAGEVETATIVTNASGEATTRVRSATAAPAIVQATLTGTPPAQATLPVEFVATVAAKLVLQVSPTAIGPNASGSTAQQAKLLATVTDANGNPVKGATVNFSRLVDPSGGNLSQASGLTDSAGQASVQYVAGALTTASNGVQVRATVAGTAVSGDASLTVNQSALFIALGTGNTIINIDDQTYQKDWVVYVTDANGVAVPNVTLTMKVLPVEYLKGRLAVGSGGWGYSASTISTCANEDSNFNGVLDVALNEDANSNGILEPGNVISLSRGTVTTDAQGRATVSLIYAESYALWVRVTLRAEAVVAGTESSKEVTFIVPALASDLSNTNSSPAGVVSPFGVNACAVAN